MPDEIAWGATAAQIAARCPNGTPEEIRAALTRYGRRWDQIPELVDETLAALAARGTVEVIRSELFE